MASEMPKTGRYQELRVWRNIAGGSQRSGQRDFLCFLGIAAGSLAEAETYLLLGLRLGFVDQAQLAPVWELSAEVGRMLNGLKRSLR